MNCSRIIERSIIAIRPVIAASHHQERQRHSNGHIYFHRIRVALHSYFVTPLLSFRQEIAHVDGGRDCQLVSG